LAEKDSKRLFFALWPDEGVRKSLKELQRPCRGGRVRATHPLDLHLTLVFLGRVEGCRYRCLLDTADHLKGRAFELVLDRMGYWSRPRILWCGPAATPPELYDLVASLQQQCSGCGFPPEKRRYTPHVTLARKGGGEAVQDQVREIRWPVREFALVSSDTGIPAPRYRVLKKWRLDS
jgi:2'-5' RNA ligase